MRVISVWIKALRLPFFTATVASVVIGTVLAWHSTAVINWGNFLIAFSGIIILNAGLNLINDYFDHTSGNDEANQNPNPFSGGSRVIQMGLISPKKMLYAGLSLFIITGLIGLWLNSRVNGNVILWIGIAGAFLAFFYSSEPLRIGYTPLGEFATGFGCGPLIILGSYYIQAQELTWKVLFASIPIGILVALILFINEFLDYDADKIVHKKTLVVTLGKKKAVKVYCLLLVSVYFLNIVGVFVNILPLFTLITLVTIPLCFKAIRVAGANYNKIYELMPANALTIGLHLSISLLLAAGYFFDRFLKIG